MDTVIRQQVIDLLKETRTRLVTCGWQQGRAGPKSGPNCLRGALRWVAGSQDLVQSHALMELAMDINMIYPPMPDYLIHPSSSATIAVVQWNDLYGRTEAQVLGLLDQTIARLS